jgi:hypothetical protein
MLVALDRYDHCTGIVVRGISQLAVRNCKDGVLENPRVVRQ